MHKAVMLSTLLSLSLAHAVFSQEAARGRPAPPAPEVTADGAWTLLPDHDAAVQRAQPWIRAIAYRALALNAPRMRAILDQAPMEWTDAARKAPLVFALPRPDGGESLFTVVESPVMEPGLAAKLPDVKTYAGLGVDRPMDRLRMDLTPQGFHAQVLSPEGSWYIDPFTKGDAVHHSVYFRSNYAPKDRTFKCLTHDADSPISRAEQQRPPVGPVLRTYRLACSGTGEYTAFHGSVAAAQAAIVTAVNRVTGVYESDVASRLVLVANNMAVVYDNAVTDPYHAVEVAQVTNEELQLALDMTIGNANYDTGHVLHSGLLDNGLAGGIGTVCQSDVKGKGYTAVNPPVGDVLAIDYLAHEIGHNFGGRHTFNNCSDGAGDSAAIAHEPGSASTIMGYAGICGDNNIQPHSDPYFGALNLEQMSTYLEGLGAPCAVNSNTGNNAPIVNAGADYTIPSRTPFTLRGSAVDPDDDPMLYSWEQQDGGPPVEMTAFEDNGQSPICRVFNPVPEPERTIPRWPNLLNNTFFLGEILPTTTRTLHWRLVARDTRLLGAGVHGDDILVNVVGSVGPFRVTVPTGPVTWERNSFRTVKWNVAGTTANGIDCASVRILFSTDGGLTFPYELEASTPNDGTQSVLVPDVDTTQGRIKIESVGNIFFNISQGGLITLEPPVPGAEIIATGNNALDDTAGNGNSNGLPDPGEADIRLTIELRNGGISDATYVFGTLVSLTPTVSVERGLSRYPDLPGHAAASNLTPYEISINSGHTCGDPINLRLIMDSDQTDPAIYDFAYSTGTPGGAGSPSSFSYTGAPVLIPDADGLLSATATVTVSGVAGDIGDVNFSFDGASCSNLEASPTVGLDHTYVGDLIVRLQSPSGTWITLSNQRGEDGNNFCQTVFDDGGPVSISTAVPADAPFSGVWQPDQNLSGLIGEDPNGVWTVEATDMGLGDTGFIRAFTLTIRGTAPPSCTPALANVCPTFAAAPADAGLCTDGNASFIVSVDGSTPRTFQWRRNGENLSDGMTPWGSSLSGTQFPQMNVNQAKAQDAGQYDCVVTNDCGSAASPAGTLAFSGDIDFNNDDIYPDIVDLYDYLNVFAGGSCSQDPHCDTIDFNNNQIFPDNTDLQLFLFVFAGGTC